MAAPRHLYIVPDTPEFGPTASTKADLHRESIDRAAQDLAGVALAREMYSGSLEGEPDLLIAYLTEVGQYPLLSQADEVTHALKMRTGKKAEAEVEAGEYIDFTEHQAKLAIEGGEIARSIMITCNLRLVASISGKSNFQNRGLSRPDLIQEGYFGLTKAVETFDPEKGLKFSTFATPHIRGAMKRALANQGRTIRVPRHRQDTILEMNYATVVLRHRLGREPTANEIATEAEMTPDKIEKLRLDNSIMHSAPLMGSRSGDEEEYESDAHLADESAQTPLNRAINVIANEQILDKLLPNLNEQQLRYVQLRYGLLDGVERTQEEVSEIMGFTRSNASLIEIKVLALLRRIASDIYDVEDLE